MKEIPAIFYLEAVEVTAEFEVREALPDNLLPLLRIHSRSVTLKQNARGRARGAPDNKKNLPLLKTSLKKIRISAAERQHNNWRDNGPARPSSVSACCANGFRDDILSWVIHLG